MAQIGYYHVAVTERVLEVDFVGKKYLKGRIEGNNSAFARKFWNRIEFKSIDYFVFV